MKHNISTHTLAAKAGNTKSIVIYNSGFGKIRPNTPFCDYSSGEKKPIDEFPSKRWVSDGTQWFLFTYLGEKWRGKGNQFDTDSLVGKTNKIKYPIILANLTTRLHDWLLKPKCVIWKSAKLF